MSHPFCKNCKVQNNYTPQFKLCQQGENMDTKTYTNKDNRYDDILKKMTINY